VLEPLVAFVGHYVLFGRDRSREIARRFAKDRFGGVLVIYTALSAAGFASFLALARSVNAP